MSMSFQEYLKLARHEYQSGRLNASGPRDTFTKKDIGQYYAKYHPDRIAQAVLQDRDREQVLAFVKASSTHRFELEGKKAKYTSDSSNNPCPPRALCNYYNEETGQCAPHPDYTVSEYVPDLDINEYRRFAERIGKFSVKIRTLTGVSSVITSYPEESLGMLFARWYYKHDKEAVYGNCQPDHVNRALYLVTWNEVSARFIPDNNWYDMANVLLKKKVDALEKLRTERVGELETLLHKAQDDLSNVETLGRTSSGVSAMRRILNTKIAEYSAKLNLAVGSIDAELHYIRENYGDPAATTKMMSDNQPVIGIVFKFPPAAIYNDVSNYKNVLSNKWVHKIRKQLS